VRELFIYYRTKVADEAVFQAAATALQHRLQTRFDGLRARLLRRPEAVDGMHTWMETYALPSPTGMTADLQAHIEAEARLSLSAWVVGGRHVEVFDACA
jgi:Domain of unknown function (DUF4936)